MSLLLPTTPPANPPKKKLGCLKIFLILCGIAAFFITIAVILVVQAVSWLKNAAEAAPVSYPPLQVSPGEQEDVDRIFKGLEAASERGAVFDEYVTPAVFNAVFEKIIEGERQKPNAKKNEGPVTIRAAFAGDKLAVKTSFYAEENGEKPPKGKDKPKPKTDGKETLEQDPPAPRPAPEPPKYINAEAVFELEIEEGEITKLSVDSVKLRGREAPFLPRVVLNFFLSQLKEKSRLEKTNPGNKLSAVKLLKREGERLHIIVDGKRMHDAENIQIHQEKEVDF